MPSLLGENPRVLPNQRNTKVPTGQGLLDAAALLTMPFPVVGDVTGLLADASAVKNDPSWSNIGFAAAGALPFVPSMAAARKIRGVKEGDELVVQHNLTADNLRNAERVGGLAMPSIGITKANSPITGYGDISLLGPPSMAKPSGRNPVYGADAYTPTYPGVVYSLNKGDSQKLDEYLASAFGQKSLNDVPRKGNSMPVYKDFSEIERRGIEGLTNSRPMKAKYLDEIGKMPSIDDFDDVWEWNDALDQAIRDSGRSDYESWVSGVADKLNIVPDEKLFAGYTDMGNPRYKPHTAENAVQLMRKEFREAPNSSMYGAGSFRAAVTPPFRNITELKDARGRVLPREAVEGIKDTFNSRLYEVTDSFMPYARYTDSNPFIAHDIVMNQLAEVASGVSRWDEYFDDVPDHLKDELAGLVNDLRNAPTEYFEAKPQRVVGVDEFSTALVPESASEDIVSLLSNKGLNVERYADDADRAAKIAAQRGLLFALPAASIGLGLLGQERRENGVNY